jgi:hypothetical protein
VKSKGLEYTGAIPLRSMAELHAGPAAVVGAHVAVGRAGCYASGSVQAVVGARRRLAGGTPAECAGSDRAGR